jgi:hypothetical protein
VQCERRVTFSDDHVDPPAAASEQQPANRELCVSSQREKPSDDRTRTDSTDEGDGPAVPPEKPAKRDRAASSQRDKPRAASVKPVILVPPKSERASVGGMLARRAWELYRSSDGLPVVPGSMPILYFGDLEAYFDSRLRVITVGKNPSYHEFSPGRTLTSFAQGLSQEDREEDMALGYTRYLQVLSGYFQGSHYEKWFMNYEKVLTGMSASYYAVDEAGYRAIHTDLCSPLATVDGYSNLSANDRKALERGGVRLWCDLVGFLRPHAVIMSFGSPYLQKFCTVPLHKWPILYERHRESGSSFIVRHTAVRFGDVETKVFFGDADRLPFLGLVDSEKPRVGALIADVLARSRD